MNYLEKRLIERLIIYPSWILLLITGISFFLGFSVPQIVQLYIVLVLGILFGFPHGATDHLVPFEILKKKKLSLNMLWLLCAYIGLLAAYLWLWFFNCAAAIILFGLLTWIHWGQGELYSLITFHGAEYNNNFGFLRKLLVIIIRGGIPLIIPLLQEPVEMTNLLSSIEKAFPGQDNTVFISHLAVTASDVIHKLAVSLILLTFFHIFVEYFLSKTNKSRKIWKLNLLETLILYFFFWTVPPLFAIGIYLFTWHSWRHLARLFLCDSKAMSALKENIFQGCIYFALKAAPTSIIATIMVVVLYLLMPTRSNDYMSNIVSYLVIISSLTLPHMVVVFWMDIKQGVWTKESEPIKEIS